MKCSEGTGSGNLKQIYYYFFGLLEWLAGHWKVMWEAGRTILHCEGLAQALLVLCPVNASSAPCPITVVTKTGSGEGGQCYPFESLQTRA